MNWPRLLLRLLGKRLPHLDGEFTAPGLGSSVVIHRDRFGVPHISGDDPGVWYGLGFCQGQDRAFQLEVRLRLVRGTLASALGPDALPLDRLSRRIGFDRYGSECLQALTAGDRTRIEAFAAGATAGMGRGGGARSHEFLLTRMRPTRYRPEDALGFLAVQAFAIASNWDVELARLRMLTLDGPQAVRDLNPPYPIDHPSSDRPREAAARLVDAVAGDLTAAAALISPGGGSNNWAVAGERTASGRPLLANDPHLAPVLPPHWYLAHLTTPDWSLTGASVPGAPLFGAGHNGHAAWGVTAGLIDNTDLFIEEVGPDGRSVRRGDQFVACKVRTERIEVKGEADDVIEVLETDRGPMVGPAFEGQFGALSMSATWLRPASLGAAFHLCSIRSFADMEQAFAEWPSLPLNVAYADPDGIGWKLIGEAPRRSGGGTIPLPAADPATGWGPEPIPSAEMPSVQNPDAGFVATANNLPTTDLYLGSDFLDGFRVARINQLLESRRDWDVETALRMQLDQRSIPWEQLRTPILDAAAPHDDLAPIARLLGEWDGVVGPSSSAASVFELFLAALSRRIAEVRAPKSAAFALGAGFTPLVAFNALVVRRVSHLIDLVRRRPDGWFEVGWDEEIGAALRWARDELTGRFGPESSNWAWGKIRQVRLSHPLGTRKPLDRIYDLGPIALGGDANTINPAPVDPLDPLANPNFAIASFRFAVEVGDWERARYALPGGQSGNPFSPHYADQLPLWERGDGLTIAQTAQEVSRRSVHTLTLLPG